ncbi:hypothetical protein Trydic_g10407 [Trypoxylus dichotomus]
MEKEKRRGGDGGGGVVSTDIDRRERGAAELSQHHTCFSRSPGVQTVSFLYFLSTTLENTSSGKSSVKPSHIKENRPHFTEPPHCHPYKFLT